LLKRACPAWLSLRPAWSFHAAIFGAYAASATWAAVHAAQFACMAILLGGLFALFFALDAQTETARWAARFGAAATVVTLALCGGVLAVDGVALKQAVNAWADAPETEKTARFAVAEGTRWLGFLMGLAAVTYFVQGWVAGTGGLSQTQTITIILAEVLNAAWMTWLLVVAWWNQDSKVQVASG
jgi:hypothetical protein